STVAQTSPDPFNIESPWGDPYQSQIERTVALVGQVCGLSEPTTLCYQSRVGPQRWLRPSLEDTIRKLAAEGAKSILVVPVSFVSDHLETLSEIDIEARRLAIASGVRYFATMPGLNGSAAFIEALADLALGADPANTSGPTA
ncbi:MAG: ferrochelatase, partial [Bryobacterales bacterium]|nr:ferrochelatase [Bryobacterales bacterium]